MREPGICHARPARVSSTSSKRWCARGASWTGSSGTNTGASRTRGVPPKWRSTAARTAAGFDRADDDDDEIVGHITGAIVGDEIVARDDGEYVAMADDRIAIGMGAEGCFEKSFGKALVGIVARHGDLAQNDVALACHLVDRQGRVQGGVGEQIDGHADMLRRQVNVVNVRSNVV